MSNVASRVLAAIALVLVFHCVPFQCFSQDGDGAGGDALIQSIDLENPRGGVKVQRGRALPESGAVGAPKWAFSPELLMRSRGCGAACAFAMLRLNEVPCVLRDVQLALQPSDRGVSLEQISSVLKRSGLRSRVVRVSQAEVLPSPPFIGVLESPDVDAPNHFVVVTALTRSERSEMVSFLDGSAGLIATIPLSEFRKSFAGYALLAKPPAGFLGFVNWALVAVSGCLVVYLLLCARRWWAFR